jgi:NTE family protein
VLTSARDITARINQLTFGQPMLPRYRGDRDSCVRSPPAGRASATRRTRVWRVIAVHLIEREHGDLVKLGDSKGKPDIELLTYLHGAGRSETEKWLERSRRNIGRRASVDLRKHFLSGRPAPALLPPEAAA